MTREQPLSRAGIAWKSEPDFAIAIEAAKIKAIYFAFSHIVRIFANNLNKTGI